METQPLTSGSALCGRQVATGRDGVEPQREAARDTVSVGAGALTQLREFKIPFLKIQWVFPSHGNTLILKNGKIR